MIRKINNVLVPTLRLPLGAMGFAATTSVAFAVGLQPLDDAELASVSGQDGLTIMISAEELAMDAMRLEVDKGTSNEATLVLGNTSYSSIDLDGKRTAPGVETNFTTTFDVGSDAQGNVYPGITLNLDHTRFYVEELGLRDNNQNEVGVFGELAQDGSGELQFYNLGGLFNNNSNGGGYLYGRMDNASMYYRQIHDAKAPYLILADGTAEWRVHDATIGITSEGVRTAAPFIDMRLGMTTMFKQPESSNTELQMVKTGAIPMYHFGWAGTATDAELVFKTGGVDGTEGLNFSTRWNYLRKDGGRSNNVGLNVHNAPNESEGFRWIFGTGQGHGNSDPVRFELTDWRNMPGKEYAHNFPYIALDLVNAGASPRDLCWGATASGNCSGIEAGRGYGIVGTSPSSTGALVSIRDGALNTYSESIRIYDDYYTSGHRDFSWGLIYTFANLDADVYLYPKGHPDDPNRGLSLDINVMAQTLNEQDAVDGCTPNKGDCAGVKGSSWENGTHLLIADTAAGMGIGMMDIGFLLLAEDARLVLKALEGSTEADHMNSGIDITAKKTRFNLLATFGGRDLPKLSDPDLNGETRILTGGINYWNYEGFLNLRISPPHEGNNYLGYSLGFRATSDSLSTKEVDGFSDRGFHGGGGTYFSMTEPSQPQAELRFGEVTGDMAFVNGKVELIGTGEEGDKKPKLRMTHDILVGTSAAAELNARAVMVGGLPGGQEGQAFAINNLGFAGEKLASIIIPSGQLHGSLSLKPQLGAQP